jgi:prephenate dehydratase
VTRLAYLGPSGTYTEAAAIAHDAAAELIPTATVEAAMLAARDGEADAAVCAVENSLEGSASIETLDLLLREDLDLLIRGEQVVAIRHTLVGAPDIDPRAATTIYSHPQALAQCRGTLGELAPKAAPVAALSTTAAIESALAEPGTLAVGNERAAELYGGHVYARDIADRPGNETRFVVVARDPRAPTGDDKTSIAFTTQHDRAGSLVEVLQLFSAASINMTHIASRPTREQLGTYIFYVDVQGHRLEEPLAGALRETERMTHWLRIMGSYPRWVAHEGTDDA